jgi:hypothetical protein
MSTSTAHGLSANQVLALETSVRTLDACLIETMKAKRANVWVTNPASKDLADCRVREMLVCLADIRIGAPH